MKRLSPAGRECGFTLVELLVVIGIILILMSLVLAVLPAINTHTRKVQAKTVTNEVVIAVNAYYTEYAKFPTLQMAGAPPPDPSKDQWVGDPAMGAPSHNNALFYTLRGLPKGPNENNATNPRRVSYTDSRSATVSSSGIPRGGFFDRGLGGATPPAEQDGCLFDPWGKEYGVIMDTTGDEYIDLQGIYVDFSGVNPGSGKAPRKRSGAFSMGKDGTLGAKGDRTFSKPSDTADDVLSWD